MVILRFRPGNPMGFNSSRTLAFSEQTKNHCSHVNAVRQFVSFKTMHYLSHMKRHVDECCSAASDRHTARAPFIRHVALALFCLLCVCQLHAAPLVFQSDFGLKDGAVAAMKGVAVSVDPQLDIYDLTHEIPVYNIWEAALRLEQVAAYWPAGTVFVSVVDPGVGSDRASVVLKTKSGHYFVTPDNGTLTFVADSLGIEQVREIDEARNRLENSDESYTFHGRDVYAYTGARLAAGVIEFSEVGPELGQTVQRIPHQSAVFENGMIIGGIPVLDVRYGNVWTNIDRELFEKLGLKPGERVELRIFRGGEARLQLVIPYVETFSSVPLHQPLSYLNSLANVAFAINQGNFAEEYGIASGPDWRVELSRMSEGQ